VIDVIADVWGLLSIMVGPGVVVFWMRDFSIIWSTIPKKLQQKSILLCCPSEGMLGWLVNITCKASSEDM